MVPFQFRVAVVDMPRLEQIFLLVLMRKLGQPFMNADKCLIIRFEAGVFCKRTRLRALEVQVSHLLHERNAGIMYRIKNYAVVVLVEDSPLHTSHTAPFRCSRICVGYVDRAKLGFVGRRGDCESWIVFVSRLSG